MKHPWHSDADLPYRRRILQEIHNFFTQCPQVSQTPEWQSRFPDFLQRLELTLYLNADCREEYADNTTVVDRLRSVTLHLQRQRVEQMQRASRCCGAQASAAAAASAAAPLFRRPGEAPAAVGAIPGCLGDLPRGSPTVRDTHEPVFNGIQISRDDVASVAGVHPSILYGSGPLGVGASQAMCDGYRVPSPAVMSPGRQIAPRGMLPGVVAPIGSRDLRRSASLSEAYKYVVPGAGAGDAKALGYGEAFHSTAQGVLAGKGGGPGRTVQGLGPSELRFVSVRDVGGAGANVLGDGRPGVVGLEGGRLRGSSQPGFHGANVANIGHPGAGGLVLAAGQGGVRYTGGPGQVGIGAGGQLHFGAPSVGGQGMEGSGVEGSLLGGQHSLPLKVSGAYPLAYPTDGFDQETGKLIRSLSASGTLNPQ